MSKHPGPNFAMPWDPSEYEIVTSPGERVLIALRGHTAVTADDVACCVECGMVLFDSRIGIGSIACPNRMFLPAAMIGHPACTLLREDDTNIGNFIEAGLRALGP